MTPSDSRHSFPVMRLVDESRSKTWSRTFRVSRIVPKNSSEIPQWNMFQTSTNSRVLHDNWEKNSWTTGLQISNNGECFPAIRVVITTFFGKSLTNFRYFVATRDSGFPRVGHKFALKMDQIQTLEFFYVKVNSLIEDECLQSFATFIHSL